MMHGIYTRNFEDPAFSDINLRTTDGNLKPLKIFDKPIVLLSSESHNIQEPVPD